MIDTSKHFLQTALCGLCLLFFVFAYWMLPVEVAPPGPAVRAPPVAEFYLAYRIGEFNTEISYSALILYHGSRISWRGDRASGRAVYLLRRMGKPSR